MRSYNVILKEINEKQVLAGVERIVNDLQRIVKVETYGAHSPLVVGCL